MIPPGWTINRTSDRVLATIVITAPNGYSAVVTKIDRNPANVLYMLAETLMGNMVSGENITILEGVSGVHVWREGDRVFVGPTESGFKRICCGEACADLDDGQSPPCAKCPLREPR